MHRPTPILVTASVLVDAPVDIASAEALLNQVSDQIGKALDCALEQSPVAKNIDTYSFHWLADPKTNAEPCAGCGRWTTDRQSQSPICGLPEGIKRNGQLFCDECRCFGQSSR